MIDPIFWVVAGGLLEPVWVIGLKRYNTTRSLRWGAFAALFMFLSPGLLALGMKEMPVGVSYSIWTGIGMVMTLVLGMLLYKERPGMAKGALAALIMAGAIGLELSQEAIL